jgi:iron complex outermembrane recepter protein
LKTKAHTGHAVPLTGLLGLALACTGHSARAADADAAQGADSVELGEVVVTAQKRVERAIDVPMALTSVNAPELVANNNVNLDDYFRSVPGLTLFDNGQGFKLIALRGITTGYANTPTTGIYIDDTPIGSSTASARGDALVPDIDPGDLQRIEVLKGPQGTLYGASNMGGLIKYVTAQPDPTKYSGRVEVDGSSVDNGGNGYGVRGMINMPLIANQLAVRLSVSDRQDPGFITNVNGGERNLNRDVVQNGHLAVLWTPSDDLSVKLNVLLQDRLDHGSDRADYDFATHQWLHGDLEEYRAANAEYDKSQQRIYNATVNWNMHWATLTSSTSYADNKFQDESDATQNLGSVFAAILGNPDLGSLVLQQADTGKFTQEFRLAGTAGPVDWLSGLYFTHESSSLFQLFHPVDFFTGAPLTGLPELAVQTVNSSFSEIAGFVNFTYHLTPDWSFQAGVRYSHNEQTDDAFNGATLIQPPANSFGASHDSTPTFNVATDYKLARDTALYARVASGYRVGGPNYTLAGHQTPFAPDKTINYEVGTKASLFDHTLYVEFGGYWINWTHVQLLGVDSQDEEFYSNGGGAQSRGVEFVAQYRPVNGLEFGLNLSTSDAHLTSPAPDGIAGATGDRLPYSPRISGSATVDYSRGLFGDWVGTVGGDYSYQGDRFTDFQPSFTVPRVDLPSYRIIDLHLGIENERYAVNMFVKNVANERGFLSSDPLALNHLGPQAVTVTVPRLVGVSLLAKF